MTLRIRLLIVILILAGISHAQGVRFRDEIFQNVDVLSDVAYGSALNNSTGQVETLLLDRYEPVGDTWAERPAVVVVHGGGFVAGDKTMMNIVDLAQAFARRGYVAVSINYRLTAPGSGSASSVIDDAKEDFKASVRFLRSMAGPWGIDTDRIACIGSSAGAFTVLAGAYVPGEGQSGNPGFSSEVQAVVSLAGAMTDVSELEAGEAPICIIHGTSDPLVPYSSGLAVYQQAVAVGVPAELHPMAGVGHNWYATYFSDHLDDNVAFFWEQLQLGMLAGLGVQPGYAAPGMLVVDSTGIAEDRVCLLAGALAPTPLEVLDIGALCIDPAALAVAPMPQLPASPRIPTNAVAFQIPQSAAGLSFWMQEYHTDSTGHPRVLSNCIEVIL